MLNLAVRLRDWVGAETPKPLLDRADRALALLQAINLQQNPAVGLAVNDGSGYGMIYLALRAAGRVKDDQGVLQTSQDVSDALSLVNEMLDEWQRETRGEGYSRQPADHFQPFVADTARVRST